MSKVKHEIAVEARQEFGKNSARRARKEGKVPACIYSKGKEARALFVDADAWKALSGHRGVNLISLVENGKSTHALIQEVQVNHLKNYVQHIDFLEVSMDQEIHAKVDLIAMGDSVGVAHGGILEQEIHQIAVKCKPADLPESIVADVSKLDIGGVMFVKDLVMPAGVTAAENPDDVVFHIVFAKEEAPAAEAAPAADADAPAADAAAAPAAGAAAEKKADK